MELVPISYVYRDITSDNGATFRIPVFYVDTVFDFSGNNPFYVGYTIYGRDFGDVEFPVIRSNAQYSPSSSILPDSFNGVNFTVNDAGNVIAGNLRSNTQFVFFGPIFRDLTGKYLMPIFGGYDTASPVGDTKCEMIYAPREGEVGIAKIKADKYISAGTMKVMSAWRATQEMSDEIMGRSEEPNTDPYDELDGTGDLPGGVSIPVPIQPPQTSTSTGILGLFAPTLSEVRALADFMWTDFGGTGSTVEDILKEVVQALKRSISDPLDYVVGFSLIPSQGLSISSSPYPIRFGFMSSGVSMKRILTQYFTVDCGTMLFSTVCGETFLDYAPYAKFSVYLPYIGFVDVDANDFVGHTIGVKYRGDVISGALTAYITKDGSVMYQYTGNCAVNIPLSTDSWSDTIHAAVSLVHSVAMPGNLTGAATASTTKQLQNAEKGKMSGIDSTAASIASNPSLLSPSVRHSGAVGGPSGAMGVQIPFVLREAVSFHSTKRFNSIAGYPSHYYKKLSDVRGYTKVLGVHLEGISATAEEITEIENLLMSGVIL